MQKRQKKVIDKTEKVGYNKLYHIMGVQWFRRGF